MIECFIYMIRYIAYCEKIKEEEEEAAAKTNELYHNM